MLARTHNIIAFAGLLSAAVYFPQKDISAATFVVCLVANTAGSMLPDIDQASNKLWDMLPFGDNAGKYLSKLFLSHRGLSHSLLGLFLVDKIVYLTFPKIFNGSYINAELVYFSLMIGYISHLLADSFTEEGLPLLFPFNIKFGFPPIKSWRIKTGHWFENFVVAPGVILFIFWFGLNHWSDIYLLF